MWCGWGPGPASASPGVFPVGGGDGGGEGGRSAQGGEEPADLKMLPQPSPRQQPEDLVKVQPLEFLEVPSTE